MEGNEARTRTHTSRVPEPTCLERTGEVTVCWKSEKEQGDTRTSTHAPAQALAGCPGQLAGLGLRHSPGTAGHLQRAHTPKHTHAYTCWGPVASATLGPRHSSGTAGHRRPHMRTYLQGVWGHWLALGHDKALQPGALPLVMGVGARQVQASSGRAILRGRGSLMDGVRVSM